MQDELKEDLKAEIPKDVLNKIREISKNMLEEYLRKKKFFSKKFYHLHIR